MSNGEPMTTNFKRVDLDAISGGNVGCEQRVRIDPHCTDHLRALGEIKYAPKADDVQIGGDHYKKMGDYQPWLVLQHWLTPEQMRGYLVGTAMAYLGRINAEGAGKGGIVDIEKAIHTLQKAVELSR
jgi:hypothetical protein